MEALAERVELTALFCSRSGTRAASWVFEDGPPFRHRVLGGWTIRAGRTAPISIRARGSSGRWKERPDAVISGGFSFPSAYAAAYGGLRGAGLVIHSDGTSYSERNLGRAQLAARALLMRAAGACVGNSEPAAQRFIELGAPPARVFRAPHTTNVAPYWEAHDRRMQARTPKRGRYDS